MERNPSSWSYKPRKHLRILLLGGTGFVGRSLIARLYCPQYTIICPTRNRDAHRDLSVYSNVQLIDADIHNPNTLTALAERCDVIINLVGILHETRSNSFNRTHTQLVENIIQVARQRSIKRIIAMSSLGADLNAPSEYLRSKGAAELVLKQATDLDWTIIRPSVIFGPNDNFLNQFAAILKWAPVLPLARAQCQFAPVWVQDVSAVITRILHDPKTRQQSFDLGGPEVFTLQALVERVAHIKHWPRVIVSIPDWMGYLQAWALELLPNPPMTRDNFASLSVNSVPVQSGFDALDITAHPLSVVAPTYLK